MLDTNQYRWTDQGLAGSEESLARAVEAVEDGLVIVGPDACVAFLNRPAESLLQRRSVEFEGHRLAEVGASFRALSGEDLSGENDPIVRVLQGTAAAVEAELVLGAPDGAASVLAATVNPMPVVSGAVVGAVISIHDPTGRRKAEEAFLQHMAVIQAQADLLDHAHDAIFVRDLSSSVIQYWNRAAEDLYGFPKADAIGQVSHFLLQTQFPQPLEEIEAVVVRDGRWEGELVHQTRMGRDLIVESRWSLQRDAKGQPVAFLEVNRDVSARKRAEAELARRVEDLATANMEIMRRHREMTAINKSMLSISRSLDMADVLQSIVDAARDLVPARYAALAVADASGHITQFITSGVPAEERAAIGPLPEGHGLLGVLIREVKPIRVRDIGLHRLSHGFPSNHPPMTSLLGVPILSKGRPVGNLYLTDRVGADEFSADDEYLLVILAAHAAIVIENGQLYEDVRSARDQLRAWNRDLEVTVAERTREIERVSQEMTSRVLQAAEDERGRIARELHDGTAQSLARILIDLDLIQAGVEMDDPLQEKLESLEDGLRRALDDVRALSYDLRPAILEDFGLASAIQAYVDSWTETFKVPVQVDMARAPEDRLPSPIEIGFFRVAQEALMNAGRYAGASHVEVSLSLENGRLELTVRDDGTGFDPEDLGRPSRHGGLGLYGMKERAVSLGALPPTNWVTMHSDDTSARHSGACASE